MNIKQLKKLFTSLVEEMRSKLEIWEWEITLTVASQDEFDEEQGKPYWAEADSDYVYKRIIVTVYPSFLTEDEEVIRETLIHELAHAKVAKLKALLIRARSGWLVTNFECRDATEELTDFIMRKVK